MNFLQLSTLGFSLVLVVLTVLGFKSRRTANLPPGPPGYPLIGNLLDLIASGKDTYLRFTDWKDVYGPIFSIRVAGQLIVVLNTSKRTKDLLDLRSSIYSDRPRLIMALEILSGGLLISAAPYGTMWRKLRRAAHEVLNVHASQEYQSLQEAEAAALVGYILSDPDRWDDIFKQSTASAMLSVTYGFPPIESSNDPMIARINEHMHRTSRAGLPGAYFVEFFPAMKYLPTWMAKWKRDGLRHHQNDTDMFEGFIEQARKTYLGPEETAPSRDTRKSARCIAHSLIEKSKLNNKEMAWLAGTMFGAGAETTAAALSVFMLAMVLYPDVMRKAQAQIDQEVGRDRLPTFDDRKNLPYVRAIVREVLRWRPPGNLGVPHALSQDDWYDGYFIPKGTIVMYNVWAMNRDPEVFPDFEEFRPERFLDESGNDTIIAPDTHGQGHLTYGSGRRICVGLHLANNTLFIDVACLLWACTIETAVDNNGQPIVPSRTESTDEGLIVRPKPFKCKISSRSYNVEAVAKTFSNTGSLFRHNNV